MDEIIKVYKEFVKRSGNSEEEGVDVQVQVKIYQETDHAPHRYTITVNGIGAMHRSVRVLNQLLEEIIADYPSK